MVPCWRPRVQGGYIYSSASARGLFDLSAACLAWTSWRVACGGRLGVTRPCFERGNADWWAAARIFKPELERRTNFTPSFTALALNKPSSSSFSSSSSSSSPSRVRSWRGAEARIDCDSVFNKTRFCTLASRAAVQRSNQVQESVCLMQRWWWCTSDRLATVLARANQSTHTSS